MMYTPLHDAAMWGDLDKARELRNVRHACTVHADMHVEYMHVMYMYMHVTYMYMHVTYMYACHVHVHACHVHVTYMYMHVTYMAIHGVGMSMVYRTH